MTGTGNGKVRSLVEEFKTFALRGNVIDLAVAVVIGLAFAAVIDSFTQGILMAFIAAIFGEPSFASITINIGDGVILVGAFLAQVVNFLLVAVALFAILKVASSLTPAREKPAAEAPVPSDEAVLLGEIRDLLRAGGRPGAR